MRFENPWRYSFLSSGALLLMAACNQPAVGNGDTGEADASAALTGTTWQWVATVTPVETFESVDPARYTITLASDGSVAAQFDCNRGQGTYETTDNQLDFGLFAATRMACPEDSQDFVFTRQLEEVTTFFMRDGQLFLELPYDSGTMRFRAADEQH